MNHIVLCFYCKDKICSASFIRNYIVMKEELGKRKYLIFIPMENEEQIYWALDKLKKRYKIWEGDYIL